jgi:dTDP-4-dehydrorhamnose reductase
MRLVVTGAAGMLGHRVVAAARDRGHEVVATDLPELDLTNLIAVRAFLDRHAPDAVINCAAYTDVDGAEGDEARATRINRDTALHLATAAPYLVHVSTDYVFAGDADRPYLESDPPAPRTAYGRSKLAGEEAVLAAGDGHAIVRTAWLFGEGGRNFVDTILRLGRERDELRVVVDQVGSPTWTGHLAPALVDVAERRATGILHAAGSGECSWHALAIEALSRAGASARVLAIPSEEYPLPAPRPAYSVLGTERDDAPRLPPWQEGVAGHLAELREAA